MRIVKSSFAMSCIFFRRGNLDHFVAAAVVDVNVVGGVITVVVAVVVVAVAVVDIVIVVVVVIVVNILIILL